VVDHFVRLFAVIGSPAHPVDPVVLRSNILAGVQRSYRPQGTARQILAVVSDVTRAQQLARIACPTLVLHGKADPLVPYACGEDTARRIAGARMVGIEGMGHDLPPGVVGHLLRALLPHLQGVSRP
jgi:pimeloyl-ACP methyl ester carboxylesterase